ncbi:MAG: UTP--glucose-1-phosphate uridylyltransferase [Verrucomicrobia bacterium]|nr:UTP--glucose-1-phosphate uridylyltransferase [Verrucomicrobiota bacterium]
MMHDFVVNAPTQESSQAGKKLVLEGKAAAIILAGGHGSRLGHNAPKGCFEVFEDISIYQLIAKKVPKGLLIAFMTSDATHAKTVEHFEKANYFGLQKEHVFFFQQQNLPLQNEEGTLLPLSAPDGNGALFWHFSASGILKDWEAKGIEQITVSTVDNVLADPFQPDLIGINALHNNDVSVVAIEREDPREHVGMIVSQNGKLAVQEYSEMADSERLAYAADGGLKHPLANISYFAFSMPFIKKITNLSPAILPLHRAKKKVGDDYFYKSEYFIFDLLAYADKAEVLKLSRKEYFQPFKSMSDLESVRRALKK